MVTISATAPDRAIVAVTKYVLKEGEYAEPRGIAVREVLNVDLSVAQPWRLPWLELGGRGLNHFIGACEAVQLVGQVPLPALVAQNKALTRATIDESGVAHGAYGQRVYGQLQNVVEELERDPASRQAVVTIFEGHRDLHPFVKPKDVPCTLALQYFIRGERLHARTTMRSNDVWLGLPYDLVQFIALQGAIASALGLKLGTYHHSVGSMHIYERDVERASGLHVLARPDAHLAHALDRPDAHLAEQTESLWRPGSIGEISRRAREAAAGDLEPETTFEHYLMEALHG